MGLNLQSLSITSAFNSIVNFFKSQENNSKWKDLTTGSEGSFLIRLLSNVFSAISYRVVAQSRENYLSTATLVSSNIGLAVNLGYSAFRGSNLKRLIKITPNGNYTLPKLSVIGTYSDEYDIMVLNDTTLVQNVPVEVETVVGKVKEETFTAGTSAIKIFSLFTTGISEDYTLYLDSTEVPTTKVIKEMKDDKYLVRTNPYSSVDVAYLNTFPSFQYKYGTGSEITIRYVELANMEEIPYTADMFSYGELTDVTNISSYLPFATVDELKVKAPLDHELQNLIRSKADYAGRLQEIVPAISDTDFQALTPTYTLISYLKNDCTLLTGTYVPASEYEDDGTKPLTGEIAQVQELLKEENFFGTPLPDITVPRREVAHLQIDIELSNKYKNVADVNLDVGNIIESFYNKVLGTTFNIYELERKIESLSYVKYARVSHILNTRSANTNYQVGYILNYNDQYYIASKILGVSGNARPDWNLPVAATKQIDSNMETVDGSIVWRAFKKLPNMDSNDLTAWQSNTQYGLGDYVYDSSFPSYMFKCVDLLKSSGESAPEVGYASKGDFVVDGGLVWVIKDYSESYDSWQATTTYRLGQSVNISTTYGDYSMECISYRGTAGTDEELEFESPIYSVFTQTTNTFKVVGNKKYYFRAGDIISGVYGEGYTSFSIASSTYSGGYTTITVNQEIDPDKTYTTLITTERGTRDGQILWKLIDNIEEITYGWNSYVTFDHTLNIIGD